MNSKLFKNITQFFFLAVGAAMAAFSLEEFLVPVKILDGGLTGISMILNYCTGISLSIFVICLNIPFLILGFKHMGRKFIIRAVYAMVIFSLLLEVFHSFTNATTDGLLAVVFGGVLLGSGVGLVLRNGGCIDGTEVVALIISKRIHFSVGQIIFGINIFIYAVAGFMFGWERAMYSLLTYFISFKVIDMVENGLEQGKALMIITNDAKSISEKIYRKLGRTCTLLEGEGLISGKKTVLYCVVTRIELAQVKRIVNSIDESAFMTVSNVEEIYGTHIKKRPDEETKAS